MLDGPGLISVPFALNPASGGEVDLYIMRLGSMRSGPIYVVNEFQRID